jgi:hypothetical protein
MGNYFVKICATTSERLRDLQRVHDLDVFHHTARQRTDGTFEIKGLLSDVQIDKVRIEGYEVEVTADAGMVAKERLKETARRSSEPESEVDKKQHPDG